MAEKSQKDRIGNLKDIRNKTAHGVRSEISEKQFEKEMQSLKKIADHLFRPYDGMVQVWKQKLKIYRVVDKEKLPTLLKQYESWSNDVMAVMISFESLSASQCSGHTIDQTTITTALFTSKSLPFRKSMRLELIWRKRRQKSTR